MNEIAEKRDAMLALMHDAIDDNPHDPSSYQYAVSVPINSVDNEETLPFREHAFDWYATVDECYEFVASLDGDKHDLDEAYILVSLGKITSLKTGLT